MTNKIYWYKNGNRYLGRFVCKIETLLTYKIQKHHPTKYMVALLHIDYYGELEISEIYLFSTTSLKMAKKGCEAHAVKLIKETYAEIIND